MNKESVLDGNTVFSVGEGKKGVGGQVQIPPPLCAEVGFVRLAPGEGVASFVSRVFAPLVVDPPESGMWLFIRCRETSTPLSKTQRTGNAPDSSAAVVLYFQLGESLGGEGAFFLALG